MLMLMLMLMPMPHVEFFFRCRFPACLSLSACPLSPSLRPTFFCRCHHLLYGYIPGSGRIPVLILPLTDAGKAVDDRQWMRGGFDANYAMDFADSSSMGWLMSPVLAGKKPRQDQGLGSSRVGRGPSWHRHWAQYSRYVRLT